MTKLIVVLAATTALAGCATAPAEVPPPPVQAETVPPVAPVPESPKPQYGTYGFDTGGMDRSFAPGDNFYQFANGTWAKSTPIPADKSNYGSFNILDDLSRERTRGLIEEQSKDPNSKIGAAYASFMDQAAIDAKGLAPFEPWLNQVRGLQSKNDLASLYAEADRLGISGPVGVFIGQDDKAPDNYSPTMFQAGIGMPDRDYYLSKDAKLAETRAKYLQHLTNMLNLAGEKNAAARAKAILYFETGIARVHWTKTDSRDANKTYNKMTVAQLDKMARGYDFGAFLKGAGINENNVIVAQPSAFKGIAALIGKTPVQVLKDQLLVRSLDTYSDYLPQSFDNESFSFFGTALSGTPQQEDRWKRAVTFTTNTLGDDVSRLYVAKYFPPETKAAADELVRNVIAAMDRRIDQLEWMAPETKVKAHAKLAAFTPKIGYPSQWRDMSGLQVDRNDVLGNAMRSARFEHEYQIGKLGGAIRRWEWGMTPMEINAYANFGMVEIVFPAAILQPPFFDPNADPAVNYGGIGAVIGHELSHHFDDQGAKYDSKGQLIDWWTPGDTKAFTARLDKLEQQYNAYEPLPGLHVNGKLTMGENVADLAGLTVAHDAYIASLGGKEPPVIDGTTGDQRFYYGWAQVWRRNYREPNLRQRLLTDPHSPSEQRASIVRNMDPWYNAFGVQAGQKLYLAPADRVRIW
ncbi:M13 family metallopeptidase [Sphingomonas hankyongi]|uniref:M13 family metallopeptidase n=1 Tax=Sphingomonas hankyongi TaxID=2908209 RepID=A0ABT0S3W3_9SPHN|nr:M13 family metallopeptidase [Sphingomonas hankyongi]MCL6730559.1 M13 family metallopeptidase [Sphingomonas hankyongi]